MPRGQYDRNKATQVAQEPEVSIPVEQPVSRRADETRRERRRRNDGDLDGMAHLKLTIPPEIKEQLAAEGKVVRFFLEGNVPAAYQNDWDPVEGVNQILANPKAGEQDRLVLCAKYKDWHEADQSQMDRDLNEKEQALMTGRVIGAKSFEGDPGAGDNRTSAGVVVPRGQVNRVSRQRGL